MITRSNCPRVDMHMLNIYIPYPTTHIGVIELLAVHVEEVCIPLLAFQTRHGIRIAQIRNPLEGFQGRDEGKLVEVTGRDDRR
jgi:hypothetical protein